MLTLIVDKNEKATLVKSKLAFWEKKHKVDIRNYIGRIEILNPQGDLEVVYFPMPALVRLFWKKKAVKEYRDDIIFGVTRDNPEEKVMGFQ